MAQAVLVDLDGVLYVEDSPLPGAVETIESLRSAGLVLRFVTNTTSRSRAATLDRLARLGFDVPAAELVTPAVLAQSVCRERGHQRVALFVAEGVHEDLADLDAAGEGERVDAVIVGDLGEAWDYAALNRAFRLLMDGADDRLAFAEGARGDMDVAQEIVVLRAFMRDDLRHAAGANDEDVLLHFGWVPPFEGVSEGSRQAREIILI